MTTPRNGRTAAHDWWTFYDARPWLSADSYGLASTTEASRRPYDWPCINSHFGILDTCGFPKDNFWYYRSWWQDWPVLHLLPHWNWAGKEGQMIEVRALSNCDEVELFLNGQSLGKQAVQRDSQLKWKVKYVPGVLSAKGSRAGKVVAEEMVETTGAASAVQLHPDRPEIDANGEDILDYHCAVVDEKGRVVPVANHPISFELEGPGRFSAWATATQARHEPDTLSPPLASRSLPSERLALQEGNQRLRREHSRGRGEIRPTPAGRVPMSTRSRAHWGFTTGRSFARVFQVSAKDLAMPVVELWLAD